MPAIAKETARSLLRFAVIQSIEGKQELTDLAPQRCFITAEAVEHEVRQVGETQKATREVDGRINGRFDEFRPGAGYRFCCVRDAVRCWIRDTTERVSASQSSAAVAEAVQRPTTRFVPAKTDEQLDLQALHRVRSRLVSERTAVINQIRGFLLERGVIVRQGQRFLRQVLPDILARRTDVLSPRMVRIIADLASDWRRLDERIEVVTDEIETLAKSDDSCRRVKYGRCPRCKRNLTISEAFGCGHVFGLLSLGGLPRSRCSRYGRWP